MAQTGRTAIINGRALISASQILEAIRNVAAREAGRRSVSITEADRRNALQKIINLRKLREKSFPSVYFGDPFWDIILNLSYDSKFPRTTSITSICIESGLPIATGLRYLNILVSRGIVCRSDDPNDGRRSLVSLTDESINSVDELLNSWIQDISLMKLSELDFELMDSFQES